MKTVITFGNGQSDIELGEPLEVTCVYESFPDISFPISCTSEEFEIINKSLGQERIFIYTIPGKKPLKFSGRIFKIETQDKKNIKISVSVEKLLEGNFNEKNS